MCFASSWVVHMTAPSFLLKAEKDQSQGIAKRYLSLSCRFIASCWTKTGIKKKSIALTFADTPAIIFAATNEKGLQVPQLREL